MNFSLYCNIGQVYNSSEITEKESIYNFRVIWRFFDAIKMVTPYCKFIPGETRLQAINYELKRRGLSLSHYYNADGILIDKDFDLELVILETTGPFGLKDVPRETTDHIKAAYGLLAMLHKVAYCYEYADADIFKKLKVYFVHAAEERLRLWSFGLVQKELYIFNRVRSANLSLTHIGSKENFMDVTNLMWELKINIDNSHKILQDIKKNHEENKKAIEQGLDGHEKIKKLEELLAETAEVKLSSRVSEAEDIYVFPSDNE
ncbi:uncharacterized protein B0P05DRAFT_578882 [Gilbertella persicaria]|uniref:uncharacterized protein n=1 Tax=Gilbertella persicaria TaxID=101096 RepID=UPI002220F451|nr:uncharacterized protein B0P05DRAFT_578882 [Gilbertella persicaria]KAI8081923.1 hypothetical protein B0P05DRAFT_578882 [Gilbertella persicaria]